MKKLYIIAIIFLFILPSVLHSSLIEMGNEFIKIIADTDTARFIIKTTGGDPKLDSDQDSLLLYEDYPPTSFTTLQVDGREYKFGSDENGMFTSRLVKRDDVLSTVWNFKNIDVKQTLKIVKGPTTGNLDTIEIQYDVINKDRKDHEVGIRVMLDTYLGKEDGAPFRIPDRGNITEEKMLSKDEVPEYWYSYDDLEKPSVIAQGTLRLPGSPVPSMLIFASWERFNKYLWDFSIKSGRSFRRSVIGPLDSALAMYWPIGKLKPNENYTIKTYYGLMAKEAIPTSKVIQITLGGPSVTTGEAVKVTANIKNTSKYEIKNVKAEMILPPDGLKLNFNENSFKNLATLKKEESKDTGWSIIPSKTKTGSMTIRVKVTGTIKDKEVIEIAEKVIEYKEVTYTLYDFSYINRLINRVNQNKENNNNKLNDVNRAISEKLDAVYSQENRNTDREAIDERIKDSQKIKEEIPKAVNSAIKNEKK